jgi:uncharacterized protein HemX
MIFICDNAPDFCGDAAIFLREWIRLALRVADTACATG